ncbi:MAG: hypothetical protein HY343_12880 [Lentisphaerae bacterium]|nr:hypothetical protein [Lentisphaerota bacterium]
MNDQSGRYRWESITPRANYAPRDGAGALVFKDRMWLIGGWNPRDKAYFPTDCVSDVWSSTDGRDWRLETPKAPWEERHTAGYVVHRDRLWVVGGDPIQGHYQPDVWSSADGVHWDCVCKRAPWGMRILHVTAAFAGKIWVMGGQTLPEFAPADETFFNDVWCSEDGATWERVVQNAPWAPRGLMGGQAVFKGRLWLIGGGIYETASRPYSGYAEVWSTADGRTWERHGKEMPWIPRIYHDVAVFDDKLWLMEGQHVPHNDAARRSLDGTLHRGNSHDVWCSVDGERWEEIPGTPWADRHAASVFVYRDALWLANGCNLLGDVWRLTRSS